MTNITLAVNDALYQRARERAEAQDTSVTHVLQRLLEQWAGQDDRAALLARLKLLFDHADTRDRDMPGSAGPFSRKELYAERLDRFC